MILWFCNKTERSIHTNIACATTTHKCGQKRDFTLFRADLASLAELPAKNTVNFSAIAPLPEVVVWNYGFGTRERE